MGMSTVFRMLNTIILIGIRTMTTVNTRVKKSNMHRKVLPAFISLCASTLLCAQDNIKTYRFHLEPQLMEQALLAYASQSGVQVLFTPEDLAGLQSRGIQGRMDRVSAIKKLLAGFELEYRFTGRNTLIVHKPARLNVLQRIKSSSIGFMLTMISGAALSSAAVAEDDARKASVSVLDEIVVTAQKTVSTAQRTPAAISVVSGSALADMAKTAADDALRNIIGVEVQGAARGFTFSIRGLGSDLPPGVGESSVSTNFDGVYSLRAESGTLGFYDLNRIEVLRGPQGTLYGRNATAGVINVVSNTPVLGENSGAVSLGVGNLDLFRGEAAANIALGENAALRVALAAVDRDGYISDGRDDAVASGGRAQMLFRPNESLTWLAGLEASRLGGKGPGSVDAANYAAGDHYRTTNNPTGDQSYNGYKFWTQVDAELGPGVLTVLPAYQTGKGEVESFFQGGGRGTDGQDPKLVRQKSLEVRYAAQPDASVQWVVGYYHYDYKQHQTSYELTYDAVTDLITRAATEGFTLNTGRSNAIFGQVTVPLAERFRFVGGARHTSDRRTAQGTGPGGRLYDGQVSDEFFDWKLGFEADIAENSLLYASAATGFRPGGTSPFDGGSIEPEELYSYEIGVKSRFWDERLQINADLFYFDYTDFQVVDFFIGTGGPSLVFYNADAVNWGAEIEIQALLSPADEINLGISWLDSEIKDHLVLHPADPFTPVDFLGERLPHSPKLTIKGGYQHVFEMGDRGRLTARTDLRYTSKQFVSPNNTDDAIQDGYFSGDASLSWNSANEKYSVTGYIKNFSDEAVKRALFVGYLLVGAPRTYGLSFSAKF